MFNHLNSRGYDVVIVGKAYDDRFYAYVRGFSVSFIVYRDFIIPLLSPTVTLDGFKKVNQCLDVVLEAIAEGV